MNRRQVSNVIYEGRFKGTDKNDKYGDDYFLGKEYTGGAVIGGGGR